MKKRLIDIFKLGLILIIFFNIGSIFSFILTKIGFDLDVFNYKDTAYVEVLIGLFLFVLLFLIYKKTIIKDYKLLKEDLINNLKKCFTIFGILLLVKFATAFAVSILSAVLGIEVLQSNNQNIIDSLVKNAPIMMLISSVVMAPFTEEVIFRLGFKKVIKNSNVFIVISGLVFGLIHIMPSTLSLPIILVQSMIYIALGLALAYIYDKEKNIFFVIIPHAMNNLFGILAALLLL